MSYMLKLKILVSVFLFMCLITRTCSKGHPLECHECVGCETLPTDRYIRTCGSNRTTANPACYVLATRAQGIVNRFCVSATTDQVKTRLGNCLEDEQGIDCYCDSKDGCNSWTMETIIKMADQNPKSSRRHNDDESKDHDNFPRPQPPPELAANSNAIRIQIIPSW